MTTGYTREQLAALARDMQASAPPILTQDDMIAATPIVRARMAYNELGVLLRLTPQGAKPALLFLNPALIVELLFCIQEASDANGWRLYELDPPALPMIDQPNEQDLTSAIEVVSLRLGSEPKGAILAVTDGRRLSRYYLTVELIASFLGTVGVANKQAEWWDDSMALIPNDGSKLQ